MGEILPFIPPIDIVVRCQNGVVMVFDSKGNQIPEYQGQWSEMKTKIMDAITLKTRFSFADFTRGTMDENVPANLFFAS